MFIDGDLQNEDHDTNVTKNIIGHVNNNKNNN